MLPRSTLLILDTLLPSQAHPELPYGLVDVHFQTFYDEFARTVTQQLRLSFQIAVWTAVWISPLLISRLPPLTRYERGTREHALAAMAQSRFYLLRQLILILKLVTSFCYGADPAVRAALGYTQTTHRTQERR